MLRDPAVMVLIAIVLSLFVVIVVTETGLQRTPLCLLAGLAIAMMLWMAYPPAQQLPHSIGFLFWLLLSGALYRFPPPTQKHADETLLDQFFEEIQQ